MSATVRTVFGISDLAAARSTANGVFREEIRNTLSVWRSRLTETWTYRAASPLGIFDQTK